MAALIDSVGRRPAAQTKNNIMQTIFEATADINNNAKFDRYFKYYERELEMVQSKSDWQKTPLAVGTHAEILHIIREMQTSHLQARCELRQRLQVNFPRATEAEINASIDLALRLWLMLNARDPRLKLQNPQPPQTPILAWGENVSLKDFTEQTFPRSKWQIGVKESRLHPSFTAAFMVEICGLSLEWTDCLADHLRLDRREKALRVYSYKHCLQSALEMRDRNDQAGASTAGLPRGVLIETMQSLNLLFPHWDGATVRLLEKHGQDFHRWGPYDVPATLNLMEFDRWRDRLLEVYDVIFQSPPVSWKQLWLDRRNPQQFWTFWIALLILLLTLISTIATIIQARASF